ncbi:MAG: hypothetical protein RLZZ598_1164, partial [Pseudomonadota bacterium]
MMQAMARHVRAAIIATGGALLALLPGMALAAGGAGFSGPRIGPVPVEFVLFAGVLAGVALFHRHALRIALSGALLIALYKILVSPLRAGPGLEGFIAHLGHEWVVLSNLLLLL